MGRSLFLSMFVACLFPSFSTVCTAPLPAEPLDDWIDQLDHFDPASRFEASRRLKLIGEPALAMVQKAALSHYNPRVRPRAADVAACIQRGEILSMGNGTPYWFNRVAFAPHGEYAIVTGGAVIVFDLITGKEVRRSLELNFARPGLSLSRDGNRFVTGHQLDNIVRLGEVHSGKVTQTFSGHRAGTGVHAVALSKNADRLVSGGGDWTLRLWDAKTGREIHQFPGIKDAVRSIDLSVDSKRILSGHSGIPSEFLVRLWDTDNAKEIRSFKGHTKEVTAVLFCTDPKKAFSTSMDGVAILWNLDTGKEIRRMTHPGGIYGAAFSPDGERVLTAGFGDKTVRIWEIDSGKEIKAFSGHGGAALGVAVSRDGLYALTCDARETVRLWRMPK